MYKHSSVLFVVCITDSTWFQWPIVELTQEHSLYRVAQKKNPGTAYLSQYVEAITGISV